MTRSVRGGDLVRKRWVVVLHRQAHAEASRGQDRCDDDGAMGHQLRRTRLFVGLLQGDLDVLAVTHGNAANQRKPFRAAIDCTAVEDLSV